ncbi:MAG: lysophospholipid acyltransferase family protein [Deltaproteobacteria bacterium]|nr:lysophospholipid acyltransferase family protein [Deltaproteobacteria bacterium]
MERWATLPRTRRLKNRLIAAAVRGALERATRLPGTLAVDLGARLGRTVGRVASGERRRVERHLCDAFDLHPDDPATRRLALAVFEHLGRSAGELAWAWRAAARVRALARFAPGALETMQRLTAGGRGVLFVTGHIGNWELMSWAVRVAGIPCAPVGRSSYDPGLNALIEAWRRRWGAGMLWRESPRIVEEMAAAIDDGVSVGVLIDQATDLPSVRVPFLGRPARTVIGPARLALARRIPVVVGTIRRRPEGYHVIEVDESPAPDGPDPATAWTAAWTAALERAIRHEPEQWVWMHDRWR